MDPVTQLLGLFLVLHILEGCLYVRRAAFVFVGSRGEFRVLSGQDSPLGTRAGVFIFLSPFPPFPSGLVAEPDPVTLGPSSAVPLATSRAGVRERPPSSMEPLSEVRLAQASAEGKSVRDRQGRLLAVTSSPAAARALAADFRAFAAAAPEDRASFFERRVSRRFDVEAVRARKAELERETAALGILGPLTWASAFLTLYGVFHLPFVWNRWPWFTLAVAALLIHLLLELWNAHRRLYRGLVGDRWMKIIMVLFSVPAAARARAFAARDAFAVYDPAAVASVLLDPGRFKAWAGPVWRDLRYPTGPEPKEGEAELTAVRRATLEALRRLLEDAQVNPSELERPSERDDASVAYCPRCLAQYVDVEGECDDCPGVVRRAFDDREAPRASA